MNKPLFPEILPIDSEIPSLQYAVCKNDPRIFIQAEKGKVILTKTELMAIVREAPAIMQVNFDYMNGIQ